jgi:hypothetical protein
MILLGTLSPECFFEAPSPQRNVIHFVHAGKQHGQVLPILIDKVYRAQMNSLSVPYYHMKLLAGLIRS